MDNVKYHKLDFRSGYMKTAKCVWQVLKSIYLSTYINVYFIVFKVYLKK